MRRLGSAGQATVEAIAAIPVVVAVVLGAWQLAAVVRGAILVQERLAAEARAERGTGTRTLTAAVAVPSLVPGVRRITIRVRGAVLER